MTSHAEPVPTPAGSPSPTCNPSEIPEERLRAYIRWFSRSVFKGRPDRLEKHVASELADPERRAKIVERFLWTTANWPPEDVAVLDTKWGQPGAGAVPEPPPPPPQPGTQPGEWTILERVNGGRQGRHYKLRVEGVEMTCTPEEISGPTKLLAAAIKRTGKVPNLPAERIEWQDTIREKLAAAEEITETDTDALLSVGALMAREDPAWLIGPSEGCEDGILPADSQTGLYGPPGHAKSFTALDMGGTVAIGRPWHGRPVRQCRVLYCLGEGASGLPKRLRAWIKAHKLTDAETATLEANFKVRDFAVDLTVPANVERLVQHVRETAAGGPVGLVILDTLSRHIPGQDENSQGPLSAFIDAGDAVRRAAGGAGCCVLTLHHPNREGSLRGSSVFDGALDTLLACRKVQHAITLTSEKNRDGEVGWRIGLEFQWNGKHAWVAPGDAVKGGDAGGESGPTLSGNKLAALRVLFAGASPTKRAKVWGAAACKDLMTRSTFYKVKTELLEEEYVQPAAGQDDVYEPAVLGWAEAVKRKWRKPEEIPAGMAQE